MNITCQSSKKDVELVPTAGSASANEHYFVRVGVLHLGKTVSTTVEMGSIVPWYG
jgi:hypothetical protein